MTQVAGDLTLNQNIMFAWETEVTQALSFSRVYEIFFTDFNLTNYRFSFCFVLFRFVSQITVSDFHSLKLTSNENKR